MPITILKKRKKNIQVFAVGIYIFLFLFGSFNLGNAFNQIILWVGGPLMAIWILYPQISGGKVSIPTVFLLYGSLLIFSILGYDEIRDEQLFLRYFRVLACNVVLALIVYYSIKSWDDVLTMIKAVWITCLLTVLVSFFKNTDQSQLDDKFRLSGIIGNSNGLAYYARVAIFCTLLLIENNKRRIINIGLILVVFFLMYSVVLSASRGNFIVMLIFLSGYIMIKFFSGSKIVVLMIILYFFGFIIFSILEKYLQHFYIYERLTSDTENSRIELYHRTFELITEHPFLGVGLNQYILYTADLSQGNSITHTDILDIFVQLGVFAATAYTAIYVIIMAHLIKIKKYFDILLKNKSIAIMILFWVCAFAYNFFATSWFDQLHIVCLSILVAASTKKVFYTSYTTKKIARHKYSVAR